MLTMPQMMISSEEIELIQNDKKFKSKLEVLKTQRLLHVVNALWFNISPAPSLSNAVSGKKKQVRLKLPITDSVCSSAASIRHKIPAFIRLYLQTVARHPKRKVPCIAKYPMKIRGLTTPQASRLMAPLSRPSPICAKPRTLFRLYDALASAASFPPAVIAEPIEEEIVSIRTRR